MLGRLVRRDQLRTVLAYILLALDTQDMALRDIALGKESMLHSFTSKNSDLASLLEDSDNDVSDSADSNHGNNIGKKPPKRTQKAKGKSTSNRRNKKRAVAVAVGDAEVDEAGTSKVKAVMQKAVAVEENQATEANVACPPLEQGARKQGTTAIKHAKAPETAAVKMDTTPGSQRIDAPPITVPEDTEKPSRPKPRPKRPPRKQAASPGAQPSNSSTSTSTQSGDPRLEIAQPPCDTEPTRPRAHLADEREDGVIGEEDRAPTGEMSHMTSFESIISIPDWSDNESGMSPQIS